MNKLLLSLFAVYCLCSCAQEFQSEKIPFSFAPARRLISLPVSIQGIKANMLFDTGGGTFSIDTTFAVKIAPYDSGTQHFEMHTGGGFSTGKISLVNIYKGLLNIKIGSHSYTEKYFSVGDYKKILDIKEFDGIFSLPNGDSLNIWKIDFEENYMSIFPADSFQVEEDFLMYPLKWDNAGKISASIPMEIRTGQGKTIRTSREFMIDTGSIADVTFLNGADEIKSLDEDKDSAYWLYNRHFWDATIKVNDRIELDSSKVYVYHLPTKMDYQGIIGLNFLKHFNVYFDMKNEKMYLQPTSKFERITQGKKPWHQADNRTKGKKTFIENIGDYKDNEAIKAGFKVGDEVISINGISNISSLSPEQEKRLLDANIWNYVIRRKGKILHLKLNRHLDNQIDD